VSRFRNTRPNHSAQKGRPMKLDIECMTSSGLLKFGHRPVRPLIRVAAPRRQPPITLPFFPFYSPCLNELRGFNVLSAKLMQTPMLFLPRAIVRQGQHFTGCLCAKTGRMMGAPSPSENRKSSHERAAPRHCLARGPTVPKPYQTGAKTPVLPLTSLI
jgi:hypothetical protein